jgi:bla regulator protein blaR1
MNGLNLHFVAQMSVERLLNGVAEGTVIALFAWLLLRVMGHRNSGTRFAVWFCALLAIALAPFVESSTMGTRGMLHPAAAITMPRSWSLYLFAAWATIALIGLARVAVGLWHLRTIRKSCRAFEEGASPASEDAIMSEALTASAAAHPALDPAVVRSLKESGRRIELCVSDALRVPTAIGLVKPAVVIPSWAVRELSQAELNAVILHEVAHLRRWDDWTNLAQKLLRALFFFHPAIWWVESRLSLEREMACDDMVLAQTANPRAYAKCLVSLAEKNLLQRGIALAQAAVGRMRHTSLRILQILDAGRSTSAGVWKPAPWVIAGFSAACLVTAAHAPRLVAFGDPATTLSQSTVASSRAASDDIDLPYTAPVVPASYVVGKARSEAGNAHPRKPLLSHDGRDTVHFSAKRTAVIPRRAGFKSNHPDPLRQPNAVPLVRTSATDQFPLVMVRQAIFVVMQDQPAGEAAPVLWRVSVWQFVVLPQARPQVEIFSKSI